jgi:hypothetical protein
MLLLAGSAFALELEEPSIQEQTADVLPAAVATNETAVAQVILIIEDLAPATATVTVEIEDANAPSETLTPVPSVCIGND